MSGSHKQTNRCCRQCCFGRKGADLAAACRGRQETPRFRPLGKRPTVVFGSPSACMDRTSGTSIRAEGRRRRAGLPQCDDEEELAYAFGVVPQIVPCESQLEVGAGLFFNLADCGDGAKCSASETDPFRGRSGPLTDSLAIAVETRADDCGQAGATAYLGGRRHGPTRRNVVATVYGGRSWAGAALLPRGMHCRRGGSARGWTRRAGRSDYAPGTTSTIVVPVNGPNTVSTSTRIVCRPGVRLRMAAA